MAVTVPVFAGRMIDSGGPPALPRATDERLAPPPEVEPAEAEEDERADGSITVTEPAEDGDDDNAPLVPEAPPRRWKFQLAFRTGVSHDDNIFLSTRQKVSANIFEIGANFNLTWGDYIDKKESFLSIQYAPSYLFYGGHSGLNGFEQDGALLSQWRIARLTLGLDARLTTLIGGDVDVGTRADRTLYHIALTAKYDYSDRTSFETSIAQNSSSYRAYAGSVEWVNENWVDYRIAPKTRLGLGLALGELRPDGSDTQTYQQALLRLTNPATGKLSFTASGGVEFRQFGGGEGSQTSPVFSLGASYRPFDGTEISLEASRRNYSSAAQIGQNYTATGISATLRQRLLTRFFATFSGGYEDAKYEATETQASTSRHDQYVFVRPAVSFTLTRKINIELYYQFRRNTSTSALSSFESNIAGVQATIGF